MSGPQFRRQKPPKQPSGGTTATSQQSVAQKSPQSSRKKAAKGKGKGKVSRPQNANATANAAPAKTRPAKAAGTGVTARPAVLDEFVKTVQDTYPSLVARAGKHTASFSHKDVRGNVFGVHFGKKVIRFASRFISSSDDKRIKVTPKGYPTLVFKNATEDELVQIAEIAIMHAGV